MPASHRPDHSRILLSPPGCARPHARTSAFVRSLGGSWNIRASSTSPTAGRIPRTASTLSGRRTGCTATSPSASRWSRRFRRGSQAAALGDSGHLPARSAGARPMDMLWSAHSLLQLVFCQAAPGQMRTWGIILERNISHANESAYWPRSSHSIAGLLTQDIAADGFMRYRARPEPSVRTLCAGRNLRN